MGQQQLLLLVLSTVIVGLAVVARIEAFDRGQRQATQDTLVQRAVSISTDIAVAHEKPSLLFRLALVCFMLQHVLRGCLRSLDL